MADGILIIDDDRTLIGLIAESLGRAGYATFVAASGVEGLQAFYERHPDLVVLDVMMPKMDGWKVCERLREVSDVPVIMLTAKAEEHDRLRGFRLGVDDYVIKPFSLAELAARIKAVLARNRHIPAEQRPQVVVCQDVSIDLGERRVRRGGHAVHLTPTEFQLLAVLAEHPGRAYSPRTLNIRVWGDEYSDAENVKRYIHYLRRKLEADPEDPKVILTERGFGYYLAR